MRKWNSRRVHRWAGAIIGVCFVAWIGSGLLMITGQPTPAGVSGNYPSPTPDILDAVVSPSMALSAVEQTAGATIHVRNIQFTTVGSIRVYRLLTRDHGEFLVDVEYGRIVTITPDLAAELAAARMSPDIGADPPELIDAHDWRYLNGELPVYRVRFANGTLAHVSATSGRVWLSDWMTLTRTGLVGLHDFYTIKTILRMGGGNALLWAASLGAVLVVLTGYTMSFSLVRRWKRNAATTGEATNA